MAVMAIFSVFMALTLPALTQKNGSDFTKALSEISGVLDQARTYAMSHNTYVFVGFVETDVSDNPSSLPQTTGIGRVSVAVVASKNGQRNYDVANPGSWVGNYTTTSSSSSYPATLDNLAPMGKLQRFENIHLADSVLNISSNGKPINRPVVASGSETCNIGSIISKESCATPFAWPLTKTSNLSGGYLYKFNAVINFDPQGVARVQYAGNADSIPAYIEIGLCPTQGSVVNTHTLNVAAIQIDGMTGATRIYRP